jgi:hypothetical protein
MRYLLLLLFSLATSFVIAQKAQQALATIYKKYPQEKVVLSFSKSEYIAGETILFKAYVLTGYELTKLSTNLYTELYDKNRNLLDKQIVPLFNGSGDGSFTIPVSMAKMFITSELIHIGCSTFQNVFNTLSQFLFTILIRLIS